MKRSLLVLFTVVYLVLSSCGESGTSNDSPELDILFVSVSSCDFNNYTAYYNNKYPNVKLHFSSALELAHEPEPGGKPYDVKVIEAIKSGEYNPDVIIISSMEAFRYLNSGLLADLSGGTELSAALENTELLDGVSGLCRQNEFFYGVPIQINYLGLIPNKSLFDNMNIEIPSADWTFNEYFALAEQMARSDLFIPGEAYLIDSDREGSRFFNASLGIKVSDGYVPEFATSAFINYLQKSKQIIDSDVLARHEHEEEEHEEDDDIHTSNNRLLNSIYITDLHDYMSGKFSGETILLPPKTVQDGLCIDGLMAAAIKGSKNEATARSFIAEFFSEDYQRKYATEMLLYKDKDRYEIMKRIDKNVEQWLVDVSKSILPVIYPDELINWMEYELYPRLSKESLTMEQYAQHIQDKATELYTFTDHEE